MPALIGDPRIKPPFGSVEVNWTHPLATALRGAWLFNEGAGPASDLVYGNTASWSGTPWAVGTAGLGASVANTEITMAGTGTQYDAPSHSMLVIVRSTTAAGPGVKLVLACRKVVTWAPVHWCIGNDSAREGYGWFDGSGFVTSGAVATNIDGDNIVHTLVGTYQGSGTARYFIDGKLDSSASVGSNASNGESPPNALQLNRYIGVDGGHLTGHIFLAYYWGRALSFSEAQWISADPYAVLSPLRRRRYFIAPTVSTFQAAWGARANTLLMPGRAG